MRNWKGLTAAGAVVAGVVLLSTSTAAFDPPRPAAEAPVEEPTEAAGDAAMTVDDGIYTTEQAEGARAVYADQCAQCHGSTMRGTPGGPRIVGSSFRRNWEGQSVAAFYEYLSTNMPFGRGGQLGTAVYAELAALIFQENGFPPGEAPFDPEDEKWADVIMVPATE